MPGLNNLPNVRIPRYGRALLWLLSFALTLCGHLSTGCTEAQAAPASPSAAITYDMPPSAAITYDMSPSAAITYDMSSGGGEGATSVKPPPLRSADLITLAGPGGSTTSSPDRPRTNRSGGVVPPPPLETMAGVKMGVASPIRPESSRNLQAHATTGTWNNSVENKSAEIKWNDTPQRLTPIAYDNYFVSPRVVFDLSGAAHVIYARQSGPDLNQPSIYYTTNRGGAWSPPQLIAPEAHSRWPRLAIGPDQHLHVIIPDGYAHKIYYVEGIVGGGWSAAVTVGTCLGPGPGQADIAVDEGSNVHLSWWYGGSTQYYLNRTPGGSWSPLSTLPDFITKHLEIRLAASGGAHGAPAKVYFAFSSDNGSNYQVDYDLYWLGAVVQPGAGTVNWWGPYNMSLSPGILSYDVSMAFDVTDHTLHLAWQESIPGQLSGNVYYRRSLDEGAHWATSVNISGLSNSLNLETDLSARNGTVYFAWNCNWGAIFNRSYTTRTGVWSNITDALGTLNEVIFTPALAVDDNGESLVLFQAGRTENSGAGYGIWYNQGGAGTSVHRYFFPRYIQGSSTLRLTNPSATAAPVLIRQTTGTLWSGVVPPYGTIYPTLATGQNGLLTVVSLSGNSLQTYLETNIKGTHATVSGLGAAEDTTYYYAWYDMRNNEDSIIIANPGPETLGVDLYLHGALLRENVPLPPMGTANLEFPGLINGPVLLRGHLLNNPMAPRAFLTVQDVIQNGSFSEVRGVGAQNEGSDYFWPWYDARITGGRDWLIVANPGSEKVQVTVSCGGVTIGRYTVAPGEHLTPSFPGLRGGPLEVRGRTLDGVAPLPLIATQRSVLNGMLTEVPGVPVRNLRTSLKLTWPEVGSLPSASWLMIVNPDHSQGMHVLIYRAGVLSQQGDVLADHVWTPSISGDGRDIRLVAYATGQPDRPVAFLADLRAHQQTSHGLMIREISPESA